MVAHIFHLHSLSLRAAIAVAILLLVSALAVPGQALAQGNAEDQTQQETEERPPAEIIRGWNVILDSTQQALAREGLTDAQLAELTGEASAIENEALAIATELVPQVDALKEQLEQLGPPPGEGEGQEAPEVTERRTTLDERRAELEGILKEARLVVVRARQLEGEAIAKRHNRFLRSLTERAANIVEPGFWRDAAAGTAAYWRSVTLLMRDSMWVTTRRIPDSPGILLRTVAAVLIGLLVFAYVSRILKAYKSRQRKVDPTDEMQRPALLHLADFCYSALLPIALIIYLYSVVLGAGVSTARLHEFVGVIVTVVALVIAARSLLRIYLRPSQPEYRIANLADDNARSIYQFVFFGLVVMATLRAINGSAALMFAPIEVPVAASTLTALVGLVIGARAMMLLVRQDTGEDDAPDVQSMLSWATIRPLVWIGLAAATVALLFGYVALAEFLVFQIAISLIALALLWLVLKSLENAKNRVLTHKSGGWQNFTKAAGMKASTSRQMAVLTFGITRLLSFVIAIMAILLPWGVLTQDWLGLLNRAFFGFQIGELTISLSSLLIALALFVFGYIVTRAIQRWIGTQYLPTTRMDTGLRNSITTVLGYIGIVLAAILAISAAGFNLSQLAIVAGALSVGIGFGLQSIVNNFVSGLILLAERPIKSGDWVVTSGGQGTVRRISVRSTEIETFDGATVILPNSTLIAETVTNWTHRDTQGRVIITIGVDYGVDPELVREILLEAAHEHELVLDDPGPVVYFMDYGADALVFDLRCYLGDIGYMMSVSSELRFTILRKMREREIEIPYPQRDLHIKSLPEGWLPPATIKAAPKPAVKKPSRTQPKAEREETSKAAKSRPAATRRSRDAE